jgi:hypothetical protein
MKKQYVASLLLAGLAFMPWATSQSVRTDLYDLKKSQQELEIMRGILSTTLSFVAKELRSKSATTRSSDNPGEYFHFQRVSNIESFYLYGQGAVFIIPASSLRPLFATTTNRGPLAYLSPEHPDLLSGRAAESLYAAHADLEASQLALVEATREAERHALANINLDFAQAEPGGVIGGVAGGVPGGVVGGVVGGIPGGVRQAPQRRAQGAPAPQATPQPAQTPEGPEGVRRRLAEAQERVKKRREETEEKRLKFLEQLDQVKGFLIETLANHGDSLTQVKPGEYITLVITSEGGEGIFRESAGARTYRDVLSVQKSAVSDYKAGKLTLDAFKSRVLQYSN